MIRSEQYNIKKVCIVIFCVLAIITLIVLWSVINVTSSVQIYFDIKAAVARGSWFFDASDVAHSKARAIREILFVIGVSGLIGGLSSLIVFWWLSKTEMTVSDKRVFGKTVYGKRVDLPLDSISAIGSRWPKGIAVATSSGRISFLMIKNRDEIRNCVSELLIERQNKSMTTTTIMQEAPRSDADELKKYKELLDSGVITQEEFDAKKKQLLGL